MADTPDIRSALDVLDAAFTDVPKPRRIVGCPCCVTDEQCALLLEAPHRGFGSDVLEPYSADALVTLGSEDDYIFFLPSILRAEALTGTWSESIEETGGKVGSLNSSAWTQPLVDATATYYCELVCAVAAGGIGHLDIDSVICAFGLTGADMAACLDRLLQWPNGIGRLHEENVHSLEMKGRLHNEFWKGQHNHDVLLEWLRSAPVKAIIEEYWRDRY